MFAKPENTGKRTGIKGVYTANRDMCLCYRFYYYYEISKLRFDIAIAHMENEFWISADTITARITANDSLLKDICNNAPSKASLRRRYPHLTWG